MEHGKVKRRNGGQRLNEERVRHPGRELEPGQGRKREEGTWRKRKPKRERRRVGVEEREWTKDPLDQKAGGYREVDYRSGTRRRIRVPYSGERVVPKGRKRTRSQRRG